MRCCLFMVWLAATQVAAQEVFLTRDTIVSRDTIAPQEAITLQDTIPTDTLSDKGVYTWRGPIGWLARYLRGTNKRSDKKFDMSVVLGPSYNPTTSFTLGGVACGLYSWDRSDSALNKSDVSIFGALSVTGMATIGVEGKNFLPYDKWRLNYILSVQHMPMHLWGIGYTAGEQENNYGRFSRMYVLFRPEILYRLLPNLYVGPMMDIEYTRAFNIENRPDGTSPFVDVDASGLNRDIFTYSIGLSVNYDTRDVVTNAKRGVLFRVQQLWYPGLVGRRDNFGSTDITFSHYFKVWKGGVVAYELHGLLTYGNVPWTKLAQVGGTYRMRGYYIGQYRDENVIEAQLELRQHIWSRSGAVVWVGGGNVWGRENFLWRHTLPNYGVGYRWELKQHVNVRIDCGFTKRDWNICFNVNEAF